MARYPSSASCEDSRTVAKLFDTRVILLAMLLASAGGCRQSPDFVRIIESEIIDSLLAAVPQTVIDVDALPEQVWHPNLELGQMRDSLVLGNFFRFTIVQDSLYVADEQANAIFVSGLDGLLRRRVGREGKAPLEFDGLSSLVYVEPHLFASERSRLQVLSTRLEYVATTPARLGSSMILGAGLSASATYLYAPCPMTHEFRVCPRETEAPYEETKPFLPSLGITQPPMNSVNVGATPEDRLVFAVFRGLPYVFVFDDNHQHVHTIRFHGTSIKEHAGNYRIERAGIPGVGLRHLIKVFHVLNNEYIAVPVSPNSGRWYFIRISGSDRYKHVGTVLLSTTMDTSDNDNILKRSNRAMVYDRHLYVSSYRHPYILRYEFPY